MKKFLMLLPLLLVGCAHWVIPAGNARIVSIASGTDGRVDYACNQLDFPNHPEEVIFRCLFHNATDQRQPGPAVHIALFEAATGKLVAVSHSVYALPTNPGQSVVNHTYLERATVAPLCGYNLERCIVLVEKDRL